MIPLMKYKDAPIDMTFSEAYGDDLSVDIGLTLCWPSCITTASKHHGINGSSNGKRPWHSSVIDLLSVRDFPRRHSRACNMRRREIYNRAGYRQDMRKYGSSLPILCRFPGRQFTADLQQCNSKYAWLHYTSGDDKRYIFGNTSYDFHEPAYTCLIMFTKRA